MASTTVVYLTDHSVPQEIGDRCIDVLRQAAEGLPIISVSHRPLDLGTNLVVGSLPRCWMSLYLQLVDGLVWADTEFVAIAEHDVLYSPEHFAWRPPDDETFWYNWSVWFVQWGGNHPELNGVYSYWPHRNCLSQLVCSRDLLLGCIRDRIDIINRDPRIARWANWDDPGARGARALTPYIGEHLAKYKSDHFNTKVVNVDVRHGSNFSGPRRGHNRCYELPYWGRFEDVLKNGLPYVQTATKD